MLLIMCTCMEATQVPAQAYLHTDIHKHSSYMTLIGVHEMHGRVHPNQYHVTDLFVYDPPSSSGYPMIIP